MSAKKSIARKTTRLKQISGHYPESGFSKLLAQIKGRALLTIVEMNYDCKECEKIRMITDQMKKGFIHKLPDLIYLYGFSTNEAQLNTPMNEPKKSTKDKKFSANSKNNHEEKKVLPPNIFTWDTLKDNHGYAFFMDPALNPVVYDGDFDHNLFKKDLINYLRRFKSRINILPDLSAKRFFIEKKRSGIIIETNSSTPPAKLLELEDYVSKNYQNIKIPIYFLKGISEEIDFIFNGDISLKQKNLKLTKFVKQVAKHIEEHKIHL